MLVWKTINQSRMPNKQELIVFDLFGTLIRFGVKRHPYRKILPWAKEHGRRPRPDDARQLMTIDMQPEAVFKQLDISPPSELLAQFYVDVAEELDSLTLFEDVEVILNRLVQAGVQIAVCSNLAQPYGAVVDRLLSQFDLIRCLSYQVGCIKPDDEIYAWLVRESGVPKEEVVFVGDNLVADYEGPTSFGFKAFHLVRGVQSKGHVIGSLGDLFAGQFKLLSA